MRFKSSVSIGGGAELQVFCTLMRLPQGPVSKGCRGGMFSSVAIVNFLLCVFCTSLKTRVIIQISSLVWMLIIYSGHEMCVNARDLCIQIRFRSQEKWEGEKERKGGGNSSQCITL